MTKMLKRKGALLRAGILVVFLTWLGASSAECQAQRNLSFGTIMAGQTQHVLHSDPGSAQFRVVTLLLALGLSFDLPDFLWSQSGVPMPITFGASDGRITNGSSTQIFNPHNTSLLRLGILTTFNIFIGASISPPLDQPPGNYTGTIVLNVLAL